MNPAMILTGSRLLTGPLFAFCFLRINDGGYSDISWLNAALVFAVLLELSDAFDGMVARARGEVTALGKIFDPICDAISRQTMFLAFMLSGIIPLWLFLVFLYRDSLVYLLRIMVAKEGTVLAADAWGKYKAIAQAVATFIILGEEYFAWHGSPIPFIGGYSVGFWAIAFSGFLAVMSAWGYFSRNWWVIVKMSKPDKEC